MSSEPGRTSLDATLSRELAGLASNGLRRELRRIAERIGPRVRIGEHFLLNFSSNDYLDLSRHPLLIEAAARAARDHGAGSAASRLVCGSLEVHHQLEESIANWKRCEASLAFGSGFAAAIGTLPALAGPDDIVILDKLAHACCIDAARLSGATLRVYRHNDLDQLEQHLRWADTRSASTRPKVIVVTESVFSMDGDTAPLREIIELKDRFGAWLFLDEAHAAGLFGPRRSGLAEQEGLAHRVDIHLGTLGKAVGASGGFIAGSRTLVEYLIHRARSFVFSTAPAPAAAAAAMAGIDQLQGPEGAARAAIAWERARALAKLLPEAGQAASAILPWIIGAENDAVAQATRLRDAGILAPAIRYPTVARGRARIRFTVTAGHGPGDIEELGRALPIA